MQEQPIDQEAAARGKRRLITIFCVMITILLAADAAGKLCIQRGLELGLNRFELFYA